MNRIDFRTLTCEDRDQLLRLACSLAWADTEIRPEERAAIGRLVHGLGLAPEEARRVDGWLELPPDPVDAERIPDEHLMTFLYALQGVATSDTDLPVAEREFLRRCREQVR